MTPRSPRAPRTTSLVQQRPQSLLPGREASAHAGPPVDHQENITEAIGGYACLSLGSQPSILGHRVDRVLAEKSLTRSDDRLQFVDHARD
ncbi:cell division FtsK/SpoIIIE domain protein [Mycobacterium xenopi 3993]|nr:cell division FtsK/SpoIIIE domain protein [Mycobacterium xenopi 3993]